MRTQTEMAEFERALISAVSTRAASSIPEALKLMESSRVSPDDFTSPALADVWRATHELLKQDSPLELLSIVNALRSSTPVNLAGGRKFLSDIVMDFSHDGSAIEEHSRIVRDNALRKRAIGLLRVCAERLKDLGSATEESLLRASEALQGLSARSAELGTAQEDLFRFGTLLQEAQEGKRVLCEPTGISPLDKVIGGLSPDILTIVGALPGVGKSALLATVARNIALRGVRVGFFSLEDERLWLTRRFMALESRVPTFLLSTKPLSRGQMDRVNGNGEQVHRILSNLVIDDRAGVSPAGIVMAARDMILNLGCKVIIIDHIGEVDLPRSERPDLDLAKALSMIRDEIAKKYHVAVLIASHIKRRPGLTVNDEPTLTDFANGSAPERVCRVGLGLSKCDAGLRVSVLKQTQGPSGMAIDLEMEVDAAMVRSDPSLEP